MRKNMRLIDADALIVSAEHLPYSYNGAAWLQVINDAPTADVVPVVRGEWILVGTNEHHYETSVEEKCSLCGRYVYRYDTELQDNYCPNCGADMRGSEATT